MFWSCFDPHRQLIKALFMLAAKDQVSTREALTKHCSDNVSNILFPPLDNSSMDFQSQDVGDIVANMLRQESTTYKRNDYLTTLLPLNMKGETIDGSWRQRIVEWMYGVVDHCNLRRESVSVATYFLDLASARGLVTCRKEFQLVAMTSLMLSIKLNDSTMVKLDSMVKLGRGLFDEADVVAMETKMLREFQWRVHPPTPVCFMRQFLRLLPPETTPIARYTIVEVTRFISEISACLYKFIRYSASTMALSAILIAMDRIDDSTLPHWQRKLFLGRLRVTADLESTSPEVCRAVADLSVALDNNVNLQELMRTIDAQCLRGDQVPPSKSKDVQMQEAQPSSPRDVAVQDLQ
jgi:hypothetical protein